MRTRLEVNFHLSFTRFIPCTLVFYQIHATRLCCPATAKRNHLEIATICKHDQKTDSTPDIFLPVKPSAVNTQKLLEIHRLHQGALLIPKKTTAIGFDPELQIGKHTMDHGTCKKHQKTLLLKQTKTPILNEKTEKNTDFQAPPVCKQKLSVHYTAQIHKLLEWSGAPLTSPNTARSSVLGRRRSSTRVSKVVNGTGYLSFFLDSNRGSL